MLNEIQEAYEYMYDLDGAEEKPNRINWSVFMHDNDLNGLERILTTVSRAIIFEGTPEPLLGRRRATIAMKMWLGAAEDIETDENLAAHYDYMKERYSHLDHWIQRYLKEVVERESKGNLGRLEKLMKELDRRRKQFGTHSLASAPYVSDFKLIRYDKVLANAVVAYGPLKKNYLVAAFPEWRTGTNKIVNGNPDAHIKLKDDDKILKLVAAYLLERNRKQKSNADYVPEAVNYSDISYWAEGRTKLDSSKYKMFTYEDSQTHKRRPLFEFYFTKTGNTTKVMPDREWFEYCGWDIIEATDNDEKLDEYLNEHPNAIFFSDSGACKKLQENIRYTR